MFDIRWILHIHSSQFMSTSPISPTVSRRSFTTAYGCTVRVIHWTLTLWILGTVAPSCVPFCITSSTNGLKKKTRNSLTNWAINTSSRRTRIHVAGHVTGAKFVSLYPNSLILSADKYMTDNVPVISVENWCYYLYLSYSLQCICNMNDRLFVHYCYLGPFSCILRLTAKRIIFKLYSSLCGLFGNGQTICSADDHEKRNSWTRFKCLTHTDKSSS